MAVTSAALPFAKNELHETEYIYLTGMENPHLIITGGSQTGKTTLMFLLAALAASQGVIVIVFDPKWRWKKAFGDIPHVLVYDDPEEWNLVAERVYVEMKRRYQLDNSWQADLKDETTFPSILVMADEYGSLLLESNDWWHEQPDPNDTSENPKKAKGNSPLHRTWQYFLWRGAEARVVAVAAAHQASAQVLPHGTGSRQMYGQRIALGVDVEPQSWTMLVGPGRPKPEVPDRQRGAGVFLQGTRLGRIQTAWAKPTSLTALASRGIAVLERNGHLDAAGGLRLHVMPEVLLPRPGRVSGAAPLSGTGGMAALRTAKIPGDVPDTGTTASGDPDAANGASPTGGQQPDQTAVDEAGAAGAEPGSVGAAGSVQGAGPSKHLASAASFVAGHAAAATYLNTTFDGAGYTAESFRKARSRRPVEGETEMGGQPAWHQHSLRAWHRSRPIAGRRSDAETPNGKKPGKKPGRNGKRQPGDRGSAA